MTLILGHDDAYRGERWNTNHAADALLDGADPHDYMTNVSDGLDLFRGSLLLRLEACCLDATPGGDSSIRVN
ncbi:hypothetical protein ACODNH_21680 (plasmid) [Haloarcula sp. NS06]|uniref:hypothetical protein n=1 Tax=Haloarcula sp. NS06 TaxID=3409688 RepID=UPI003DA77F15